MNKSVSELYEQDFSLWINENVEHLKHGDFKSCDLKNIIEELEGMGNSQLKELRSRLIVLLGHLLKWKFQQEKRSGGWLGTIRENRREIEWLLIDSPSLRNRAMELVNSARVKRDAIDIFVDDTGKDASILNTFEWFTLEQILDNKFLPE